MYIIMLNVARVVCVWLGYLSCPVFNYTECPVFIYTGHESHHRQKQIINLHFIFHQSLLFKCHSVIQKKIAGCVVPY